MKSSLRRKYKQVDTASYERRYRVRSMAPGQRLSVQMKSLNGQAFCIGYTDGKRDKALDAWYFMADLVPMD